MLERIHVQNLALIDDCYVEFGKGLNIISGETGAGKSLLIKSVELALGKKGDKSLIRSGKGFALVELEFSYQNSKVDEILEKNNIEISGNCIVVSRKITESKSIARVNGEVVTLKLLSEITSNLVALHGQQSAYQFRNEEYHLNLLDMYAADSISKQKKEVLDAYNNYIECKNKYNKLKIKSNSKEFSRDFLEFEIKELEDASLAEDELEDLENKYKLISSSEKLLYIVSKAYDLLSNSNGISDMISSVSGDFSEFANIDDSVRAIYDNLSSIESISYDTARLLDRYKDRLDFDEKEKIEVETRLDTYNRLTTKYNTNVSGLINLLNEKKDILDKLDNFDEYLKQSKIDYENSIKNYNKKALNLSTIRKEISKEFVKKIIKEMSDLDFSKIDIKYVFNKKEEPSILGIDDTSIFVSFNSGEPIKPLVEIASGGELSRVMLAVKSALGNKENMPTMIFDEIDSGISGHSATKVGKKMKDISLNHQVLSITHLSQIVAIGDNNYRIYKETNNDRTTTTVESLSEDGVILEIARILGGDNTSNSVIIAAKELRNSQKN